MPSQVNFHERYIYIKDNEVILLLKFLLESLAQVETDDWTHRVRDTWENRITGCGFGLYEFDLEKLVTNAHEMQRMAQVFIGARNALNAHGPILKKEWLNSLPHPGAIYLRDQETSRFVKKLDEIEELLN